MSGKPDTGSLAPDTVHLWCLRQALPAQGASIFRHVLSREETERAQRYRFPRDRDRFLARRMLLRRLLAAYLNLDAREVPLSRHANGKPYCAMDGLPHEVQFSVSHSRDVACFAFSAGEQALGVDVEALRHLGNVDDMARWCLSVKELALWSHTSSSDRSRLFLETWTRKEALLKAEGIGLRRNLSEVEVGWPGLQETPGLDWSANTRLGGWSLRTMMLDAGYIVSVTRKVDFGLSLKTNAACLAFPQTGLPAAAVGLRGAPAAEEH